MVAKLRVTQTKSAISHIHRNRATIRALGLGRIGATVEVPDNDATRGMVRQVRFLVSVEEVGDVKQAGAKGPTRAKVEPSAGAEAAPVDTAAPADDETAGEETA
jgi:large subunit ribosomal protein L30